MNDEFRKVCEALMELINKICTDCGNVPDGFNLSFGNDKLIITADISLEYDVTDEFIKKSESDKIVEEFIARIWKNDEKE